MTVDYQPIIERFATLTNYEQRLRELIILGKQLPVMDPALKTETHRLHGCESQAWLYAHCDERGIWHFSADSDARIVRGLIYLLLAPINLQSSETIRSFDLRHYVEQLGLRQHLSPSRGNGLNQMISTIERFLSLDPEQ